MGNLKGSLLVPGTQLNGIYEIEHLIGSGGMGEIYRGREIETNYPVAIKLMLPEFAENAAALALFRKEASALRLLQHEAIVRYYAFAVEPLLQRPYLAMEFIGGRSLAAILHDDGPMPLEAVHLLMQRMASGLHVAHERGVIHRDVSSDNIIVPNDDVSFAKIIDFGIARSTQLNDTTVIGGGFAGKRNYVSPEQLGLYGANVTPKSDVYSLGLVLVEALTGRPLNMGGTELETIEKRRKVPDLSAVDTRIRPLIEQMLQSDPDHRPPSMAVVARRPLDTLTRAPWNDAPRAAEAGPPSSTSLVTRKRWFAAATSMLVILGTISWPYPTGNSGDPPKDDEARPQIADPEGVRRFVQNYDGGKCFFVVPGAIRQSVALLDVYSSSAQPLDTFGRKFRRDLGFEPRIGRRLVNPTQCAAVEFLAELRKSSGRAPRLTVDQTTLSHDETLTGTVEGADNLLLLFVADGGAVTDVSKLMTQALIAHSFRIDMADVAASDGPQLLIAVASAQPLGALQRQPIKAQQFFPQALQAAVINGTSVTATARYFMLSH